MQKNSSAKTAQHVGLFGGTFCPIHDGHLLAALSLQKIIHFDQFIFLPNKAPVLDKAASALLSHRLTMLALALAPYPNFKLDRREVERPTPSFMVDTLMSLREDLGEQAAISLIMGSDSFQQFHRWHGWQKILSLCNLIVIERPGYERLMLSKSLSDALITGVLHEITDFNRLATASRGGFYRVNVGASDVSSTQIRTLIQSGGDVSAYLPEVVLNYIKENKLFC